VTRPSQRTPKFRVNGSLSDLPDLAAPFQCKPGSKTVRPDAGLRIW